MGDRIIIEMDSGETLETIAMKETGVGHMIGKTEVITERTIEASVTAGQGQVQEKIQTGTGLDVWNAESTTI